MQQDGVLDKEFIVAIVCAWLVLEVYRRFVAMEESTTKKRNRKNTNGRKYWTNNSSNHANDTITTNPGNKRKDPPQANLSRKFAGSNWENSTVNAETPAASDDPKVARKKVKHRSRNVTKYVAMDCEMVGVGSNGQEDMVARVSIVNQEGDVLLDKYIKPREKVIDYRTKVSGIRPKDIENGEEFNIVQDEVVKILRDKILVGHSLNNDLAVLFIRHPYKYIRDTAKYKPLAKLVANGATPSLKRLTKVILGQDIQDGEHNSVEDARAAMSIYNRISADWETYLKKKFHHRSARSCRGRS